MYIWLGFYRENRKLSRENELVRDPFGIGGDEHFKWKKKDKSFVTFTSLSDLEFYHCLLGLLKLFWIYIIFHSLFLSCSFNTWYVLSKSSTFEALFASMKLLGCSSHAPICIYFGSIFCWLLFCSWSMLPFVRSGF